MSGFFARAGAIGLCAAVSLHAATPDLAQAIVKLTRSTPWELREAIPLRFRTHHPQGLVKIGDRFNDHLGALVHDPETRSLHGISWGSRTFYRWGLSRDGRVTNAAAPQHTLNPSHYVDYQDCKFAGQRRMACTGVTEFRVTRDAEPFRLGGIELVSLRDHRPIHQVPLQLWSGGLDLTHNPVWLEATAMGLRGYFVPEDDDSTLYVYETK